MSEKDIVIGLTLNDSPFIKAMDRAQARMKSTIAEMEASAKASMDTIERRVARSLGTSAASEHRLYMHDAQALYWRDRYKLAPGLGQDMVAPGRMSREAAAAATAAKPLISSLEKVGQVYVVIKSAMHLSAAIAEAWHGNTRRTREELEKLPPLIRESALAGWKLGEVIRDWWVPKVFSANVRGEGPQTQYLKQAAGDIPREMAAVELSKLRDQFNREAYVAGLTPDQRSEYRIKEQYNQRIRQIRAQGLTREAPEYKAAVRAAQEARDAELWQIWDRQIREGDEANMAAADRQREQDRQRRDERLAAERKYADEVAELRSDIAVQELNRQGRTLDAERQQIRQAFSERIRDATEAGQVEKAALLTLMRDMQLAAVHPTTGQPGSFMSFNRQYIEPAGLSIGQQNPELRKLVDLGEHQLRELQRLVESMTGE